MNGRGTDESPGIDRRSSLGHNSLSDRMTWLGLLGAIALVVVIRVWVPFGQVFREGDVMLAGNDPYMFRPFVDQLLASGANPFNPFDLGGLSGEIRNHDVLFIVAMWMATVIFGGGTYVGGIILAVYPVVAAVLVASMVFLMGVWITDDRRVGLLSAVLLALTPAHAYRTMLGFGDHDAFGYVAVMVTATALVWLLRADAAEQSLRDPWYWMAVFVTGGGVVAATLGWRGGPILLAPIAGFAVFAPVLCAKHGRSPAASNRGFLFGLIVATGIGLAFHLVLGWAQMYRGLAPMLLLGLVIVTVGIGEGIYRAGLPWPLTLGPIPLVVGVWIGGLWTGHPAFAEPMQRFWWYVSGPNFNIGEKATLIANLELPIVMFGFLLLVAVPVMLWVLTELSDTYRPDWLLVSAYAWGFLVLASFRLRWSGLAAMFIVLFGAVGVLYLADRMDVVRPISVLSTERSLADLNRRRERLTAVGRSVAMVFLIVMLVMGTGVVQIPGTMNTITHDETTHETATFTGEYMEEHESALTNKYIFTEWGSTYAYNYHAHGDSLSYGYAQDNYRSFVSSADPDKWYDRFEGQVGFIVVQNSQFSYPTDSMQIRLNDRYGSAGDDVDGLSRFRLIYVSEDESTKVFQFVPGATITGTAEANATIALETEVTVGDQTFMYTRSAETAPDGEFSVTVPYPGEYTSEAGTVSVTEKDVRAGNAVRVAQ